VVGLSYATWFWLLTRYLAPQLAAFTFITPLVGVFAGWLAFGEAVTPGFAMAILFVVSGVALVNWPRSRAASPTS
jgi:drug/metabolite transporter (DMT)-like permease